jgi:hypothetical protein
VRERLAFHASLMLAEHAALPRRAATRHSVLFFPPSRHMLARTGRQVRAVTRVYEPPRAARAFRAAPKTYQV